MRKTSVTLAAAVLAAGTAFGQSPVTINEVCYDAPGGDDGQVFVELHGPAGFDIGDWQIIGIEGNDGLPNPELFQFPTGTLIPADGIVVVADEEGSSGTTQVANADFIHGDMDFENGPDGVHLVDNNGRLVDAVCYGNPTVAIGEGAPARDVFAPLSIERCPAGTDTDDNATDFTPNVPTPGLASPTCNAIEWVSQGFGNAISCTAGESVGFDFWMTGAPLEQHLVVLSCTPGVSPPWPVNFDFCSSFTLPYTLNNFQPFIQFRAPLDASGSSVGNTFLDFSGVSGNICPNQSVTLYVGVISFDTFQITNQVEVTIDP